MGFFGGGLYFFVFFILFFSNLSSSPALVKIAAKGGGHFDSVQWCLHFRCEPGHAIEMQFKINKRVTVYI